MAKPFFKVVILSHHKCVNVSGKSDCNIGNWKAGRTKRNYWEIPVIPAGIAVIPKTKALVTRI